MTTNANDEEVSGIDDSSTVNSDSSAPMMGLTQRSAASETYSVDEVAQSCFWSKKAHKRFYRCIITKVNDDQSVDILYPDDNKKVTNVSTQYVKKSISLNFNDKKTSKENVCKVCGRDTEEMLVECDYCEFSYHVRCCEELQKVPPDELEVYNFKCMNCKRFENFNINVRRTCERCTRLKIKCNYTGNSSVCDMCILRNTVCVPNPRSTGKRGRPPKTSNHESRTEDIIQASSSDFTPERRGPGRPKKARVDS